jgi:hypothetical protein
LEPLDHLINYDACAVILLNNEHIVIGTCKGFPNASHLEHIQFSSTDFLDIQDFIKQDSPTGHVNGLAAHLLEASGLPSESTACFQTPLSYRNQPLGLIVLFKFNKKNYIQRRRKR